MTQARDLADGKFDTNTLVVDAANNHVGVGTASPSLPLHINGASAGDGLVYSRSGTEYFRIDDTGTDMNIKTTGGGHQIIFTTNSSEVGRWRNGGGLTFNGDTAAANALDDYEEGVWAVAITPSSGSITLKAASDRLAYIKIGNLVSVFGRVQIDSVSSASGNVLLSLPFTVASLEDEADVCHLQIGYYGVDVQADAYGAVAEAGGTSSNATLLTLIDNSGWGAIQGGTFSANDFISINGVYQAA